MPSPPNKHLHSNKLFLLHAHSIANCTDFEMLGNSLKNLYYSRECWESPSHTSSSHGQSWQIRWQSFTNTHWYYPAPTDCHLLTTAASCITKYTSTRALMSQSPSYSSCGMNSGQPTASSPPPMLTTRNWPCSFYPVWPALGPWTPCPHWC